MKSKDIYAVVVLEKKKRDKLGIVPCNVDVFPRLIRIPGHENRFMLREEVILHYMPLIFDRYHIKSKSLIRIIRNADIDPDEEMYDDDTDFRQVMEQLVSRRRKLCPIKLEYTRLMDESVLDTLCGYLDLKKKHIFHSEAPLDLSFFSKIRDLLRNKKELFYPKYTPQLPADINMSESIMKQIEEKDRFLFFPYDSIQPFLRMLNEAAEDPEVVSIKMTLYRVANDSKVVEALINAAENGKEVVALVELRARFDEENNINYSEILEEAGCKVMYGMEDYKVHSKVCLITKKNSRGIYYITQIGTGNYNESTSKLYTDLSFMTASEEIGHDASVFFHNMATFNLQGTYEHLLVAPSSLQDGIIKRIEREKMKAESFQPCGIFMKMNSLTDRKIIDELSKASNAGVPIFLLIRGICCIRPGIPGKTENIRVESIVGRFLEHSRIYAFGVGDDTEIYISSADMMTRNTRRRVEVAAPIYDPRLKQRILKMINVMKQDNIQAQVLLSNGEYTTKKKREDNMNSQIHFLNEAKRLAPKEKTQKQNLFFVRSANRQNVHLPV